MKKIIYIGLLLVGLFSFSCDDYLDKSPDSRTTLDTPDKIRELMATSYPRSNYALVAEFSADNIIDNYMPINGVPSTLMAGAFDRMDREIFEWQDVMSSDDNDSPYGLWEEYYQSIASANHALDAIETLEKAGSTENMNPQRGEALILRAYSHFMLVNIFAKTYKDPVNSAKDIGITYMTEPETKITVDYKRNSVAEVYDLIAKDIEVGLPLIDDRLYTLAPKYHFNKQAANAFASQFYLYKRDYQKVIEHANAVLGTGSPSALLRDWQTIYSNPEIEVNVYISAESTANLLIIPTYSRYSRRFGSYRYGWKEPASRETDGAGPTWNSRPPFFQGWLWTRNQNYGAFHAKAMELFEYSDKVAGIGFAHVVRTEFTTDDVLLNRAEAKVMLNDINGAVQDLQYWNVSHKGTRELTKKAITDFYTKGKTGFVFPFHTTELSPEFTVTEEQKPLIDCVLHFRRLERIFEGHRWFDIKRYGIEITHVIGRSGENRVLTYDDDRRAIQIPSDVAGAGLAPNPRQVSTDAAGQWAPAIYTGDELN